MICSTVLTVTNRMNGNLDRGNKPSSYRYLLKKAGQILDLIGCKLSEEHLIRFDRRVLVLLLIFASLLGFATVFRLHGSSIGLWNHIITDNSIVPRNNILWGSPKGIRADEWMVMTPFIISQVAHGFPVENRNLGYGKTPLLTSCSGLPVFHYTALFKPQSWPFFLFDLETAFSLYWNGRGLGLFIGFFFLLMLLTRNHFWLSIVGSLWLYFSSYIQWWFGIQSTDHLIALCMMVISAIYLTYTRKKGFIVLSSALFITFSLNLSLAVYQSWQVVTFYLFVFLFFGYLLNHFNPDVFRLHSTFRVSSAISCILIPMIVLAFFYFDIKDTVQILIHTYYPGNKFSRPGGGQEGLLNYFSGFFNLLYREDRYPFVNVCESMSFLPLYPVIFALMVKKYFFDKERLNWCELALAGYIVLFTIFMLLGLPDFIGRVTLIEKTYGTRPYLGLNVATIALVILFMSSSKPRYRPSTSVGVLSLLFGILLSYGFYWSHHLNDFLSTNEVLAISALFSLLCFAIIYNRQIVFSLLLLMGVALPGIGVNPISYGLSPFYDKDLSVVARTIAKDDPQSLWLFFGNNYGASFLKALGLNVFNGVHYVPDLKSMEVLDPGRRNRVFYNRYAHIEFHTHLDDEAVFTKGSEYPLHDHIKIYINPASQKLRQLGVRYIVLPAAPPGDPEYYDIDEGQKRGLIPITPKPVNRYWICKLTDQL